MDGTTVTPRSRAGRWRSVLAPGGGRRRGRDRQLEGRSRRGQGRVPGGRSCRLASGRDRLRHTSVEKLRNPAGLGFVRSLPPRGSVRIPARLRPRPRPTPNAGWELCPCRRGHRDLITPEPVTVAYHWPSSSCPGGPCDRGNPCPRRAGAAPAAGGQTATPAAGVPPGAGQPKKRERQGRERPAAGTDRCRSRRGRGAEPGSHAELASGRVRVRHVNVEKSRSPAGLGFVRSLPPRGSVRIPARLRPRPPSDLQCGMGTLPMPTWPPRPDNS
jgi:hypothetical protein